MWLEHGFTHLIERVRGRAWQADVERLEAEVQRFGDQAWRRIAARWPALADLVREHVPRARYRPAAATTAQSQPPLELDAIDALIAQLSAASAWQTRVSAALSLAHVEADSVVPALVRALRDPSAEVAVAAVDALASHQNVQSTSTLLAVLENPDGYFNPMTRVAAMSGLARRLPLNELAPIFAAVRDIDAEVSIAAVAVIGERAPALADEHLLPILRDANGYYLPLVRLAAANALDRAGCLRGSLPQELLQAEGDPAVRRVLQRAQQRMAPDQAALT
jgi:HEAT repeat protein